MTNQMEIQAAALRWHTAHGARLFATKASNAFIRESKQRTGFGGSDVELSQRVRAAKRVELAALRTLAKVCESVRGTHIDDAPVNEVPVLITYDRSLIEQEINK